MIRVVLYLFLAIFLISLIRAVAGVVMKVIGGFAGPRAAGGEPGGPRMVGELKRDPVCGTYVSTQTSIKRTIGGEVVHFCSPACSEKYRPS